MVNITYRYQKIKLDQNRRLLVISDIHGCLQMLEKLLSLVNYSNQDYLFILGDIIERGDNNLGTLRYLMKLSKSKNVFILMGNNDTLFYDLESNCFNDYLYNYLCNRNSLYTEMCNQLNIDINPQTDFKKTNSILLSQFEAEFTFLKSLPTVIETDKFIFAHAGIKSYENINNLNAWETIKTDCYMDQATRFPKLQIVGHYPAIYYSSNICDFSPKRNFSKKILSIDGGMAVKQAGQLNCLQIENESNVNIDYFYVDNLPVVKVIKTQNESKNSVFYSYKREKIEVIREIGDYFLCKVDNDLERMIPKTFLSKINDEWICNDYTDYYPLLEKGEYVKMVFKLNELAFIKKGSIVGWTKLENIDENL